MASEHSSVPNDHVIRSVVRAFDAGLAACPDATFPTVPDRARLVAKWELENGDDLSVDVGSVGHLNVLLRLGLAHLARGNTEAPHAG